MRWIVCKLIAKHCKNCAKNEYISRAHCYRLVFHTVKIHVLILDEFEMKCVTG